MTADQPPIATSDRQVTEAAAAAVSLSQGRKRIELITLSTGVVLRLRPVAPTVMDRARQSVPMPQPPMIRNEAKEKDEPNPNHPEYLKALRLYDEQLVLAAWRAAAILGTSVESLPEGFPGPDDDRWIEELEAGLPEGEELDVQRDMDTPRHKNARYFDWLSLYAFGTEEDAFTVSALATSTVSLTEEEVAAYVESFRDSQARRTHFARELAGQYLYGDQLPEPVANPDN